MPVKRAPPEALAHVPDGHLAPAALQQYCNSFSLGPITIQYCVDPGVPQVTYTVTLLGVSIGSGVLDTNDPSVTLGGSVAGFKAQITLAASFTEDQVTYDITLCTPFGGCTEYSGVLFSW
ncbi:hypothetical protein [Longimicrobium sp.]|uniref:hypothetical protein n=1 Tax=Longimicrobium sp. TaxID=2029185 RepID=UPI002E2FD2E6|nr:hypothetical protein [Longimicrobium sp.]HEX6036408.1 hypothetical protein [Longimicrobium sp.]